MEKTIRTSRRTERKNTSRRYNRERATYENRIGTGRASSSRYERHYSMHENDESLSNFSFKITICIIAVVFAAFSSNINSEFTNSITASIKNEICKNSFDDFDSSFFNSIASMFFNKSSEEVENESKNIEYEENDNSFRIDERITDKINNEKDEYAEFQKK